MNIILSASAVKTQATFKIWSTLQVHIQYNQPHILSLKGLLAKLFLTFSFDWQVTHRPMWVKHWRLCTALNSAKPPSAASRTCSSASKTPASSNPSWQSGWRRPSKPVVSQHTPQWDHLYIYLPPPCHYPWFLKENLRLLSSNLRLPSALFNEKMGMHERKRKRRTTIR